MAFVAQVGGSARARRRRTIAPVIAVVSIVLFLTGLASTNPAPALATESYSSEGRSARETGRMVFDLTVLRPLQLVQVAVSALVFLPAYPLSWPFGGGDDVMEICITEPIDRAFRRPLGEL